MAIDLKELVHVIMACRRAKVSKLTLGELVIDFEPREGVKAKRSADETVPEMTPQQQEELRALGEHSRAQETYDTTEDTLALLHIDDPVLYEQLLIEKELEGMREKAEH